jgi:hypothetical protein
MTRRRVDDRVPPLFWPFTVVTSIVLATKSHAMIFRNLCETGH